VTCDSPTARMPAKLNHEGPTRGKGCSRMARIKRQYGSGCLLRTERGWALRWRELEIAPDGTKRRVLRYETLESVSSKEASQILTQRVTAANGSKAPLRSRVAFRTMTTEWQATVLPMYKHSTQKNHRHSCLREMGHVRLNLLPGDV
jgi:hypothetical protein